MAGAAVWARYQFLEDLWRGQDRIVFDTALEEALRVGAPGLGHQSHPALAALFDALIPREVSEENVWVALANPRRAAEYARLRGGTTFVGLDEAPGIGTDEDWQVALVDVGGMLAPASEVADEERVSAQLEARLAALLEVLGEKAGQGRTVVISVPSEAEGGLDYETFATLLAEQLPVAHVYGIGSTEAALVYDFGEVEGESAPDEEDDEEDDELDDELDDETDDDEVELDDVDDIDREVEEYDADLDAAEDEWTDPGVELDEDDEAEQEREDDDDVPVDYDNSLGDEEPRIGAWVAILSRRPLTDGLTVIELPAAPAPGPGPRDSALRAQLAQVQRQADLTAIERQRLAEQLDEAEERIASLLEEREQLLEGDLEDDLAEDADVIDLVAPAGTIVARADAQEVESRLDAALARERALRWQLNQVEAELEQARARPVEELEAEVARLRAQLRAEPSARGPAPAAEREPSAPLVPPADPSGPARQAGAETVFVFTETTPGSGESPRLRSEVDRLLRRIERGGMPTLELYRALKRLRGFFRG